MVCASPRQHRDTTGDAGLDEIIFSEVGREIGSQESGLAVIRE